MSEKIMVTPEAAREWALRQIRAILEGRSVDESEGGKAALAYLGTNSFTDPDCDTLLTIIHAGRLYPPAVLKKRFANDLAAFGLLPEEGGS